MSVVLLKLYGMDRELERKLKAKGIKDSEDLIEACASNGGAGKLAEELDVDQETVASLVNRAHLARIRGIGEAYTELLEAAGVKSVADLAVKEPDRLRSEIVQINEARRVVGRVPALPMVNGWVTKAVKFTKN